MNNTFFTYNNTFYKQRTGAAMGSPLSPVIADIFLKHFEEKAFKNAQYKPTFYKRYVDDSFCVFSHGQHKLDELLSYLNSLHPSIKFTMEIETDKQLAFLDVLIKKNDDGSLSHTIYRKKTHTDRYLQGTSHHHPSQILSVAKTLIDRTNRLTDDDHKVSENIYIDNVLTQNGYSRNLLKKAHTSQQNNTTPDPTPPKQFIGTCTLPFIKGVTEKLGRLLRQNDIRPVFNTNQKIQHILPLPTDRFPNENQGIYEIPCFGCRKSYVGRTNRRVSCRVAEHRVDVKNRKHTSALALHTMTDGHIIDFDNTKTLIKTNNESHRILYEAIHIAKRDDTLNFRDEKLKLPYTYAHLIKKIEHDTLSPSTKNAITNDSALSTNNPLRDNGISRAKDTPLFSNNGSSLATPTPTFRRSERIKEKAKVRLV